MAVSDVECHSEGWRKSNSDSDSGSDEDIANAESYELLKQDLAEWLVRSNGPHSSVGAY